MRVRNLVRLMIATVATMSAAAPVSADVTAEYVGENERQRVVIEVADNGDVRVGFGSDGYTLIVGGKGYSVEAGPGGPLVTAAEVEAYNWRRAVESGEITFSTSGGDQPASLRFVPGGAIEIAGFRGIEYAPERGQHTSVGIADDPALAPLGEAYRRVWQLEEETRPSPNTVPDNLGELLAGRGVVRYAGMDLHSVSFEPIDPARFALPAEPLLLEQVLQGEDAEKPAQEEGASGFQPPIVGALYFERELYTLTRDGKLSLWTEGAAVGTRVTTPDPVRAVCRMGDALLIVTSEREGRDTAQLWSGTSDGWKAEASFRQSEEDPFLALDCSGDEPLLLTAKAIRLPRSGRAIAIDPEKLSPGGYFTTLQHRGFLYVGANAGEWGGGLRRFALTDGASKAVDASDPEKLCGGTLNMSCDPVTGLTSDPRRPECILASVGLVHFFPHGQVVRICEGAITPAYLKPYTLDPDWEASPPD